MDPATPSETNEQRFPSGRWRGYWEQGLLRGRMELDLCFENSRVFGDGRDFVGDFMISGGYNADEATCSLLKTYFAQHDVEYDGVAANRGIRGAWRIYRPNRSIECAGIFHIWPTGSAEGEAARAAAEAELPVSV